MKVYFSQMIVFTHYCRRKVQGLYKYHSVASGYSVHLAALGYGPFECFHVICVEWQK